MVLAVLTDDAKKFLFSLILIFILVFIIIGLLGALIQKLMLWQGKKIDTLCADVVKAKVITNKKDLNKYANKKNWALFFKQSAVGLILLLLSFQEFSLTFHLLHFRLLQHFLFQHQQQQH